MLFAITFIIFLFLVIAIFSFPQFSPIPYFPSNRKDLKLIIRSLQLRNNQTVIDLGAGDGVVIFTAAKEAFRKKLKTHFIAVEINPILLCILYIRWLFHPNHNNIRIIYGNMFYMKFKITDQDLKLKHNSTIKQYNYITIYLYISPWFLEKTISNIKRQLKSYTLISYMYPVPSLKQMEKTIHGKNNIYQYTVFIRSDKNSKQI